MTSVAETRLFWAKGTNYQLYELSFARLSTVA